MGINYCCRGAAMEAEWQRIRGSLRQRWGRLRYKLCYLLFKDVVLEVLTDHLHPDFGSIWQPPDGEAYKAVQHAFHDGWRMAFDAVLAGKCVNCAKEPEV